MIAHPLAPPALDRRRVPSGIPGLDVVLGGGFLRGGVYLLAGGPGSGKTVMANQICFSRARLGEECLYVTVLSESHGRMVGNLETFSFFDPALVSNKITYISGVQALREGSLDALYGLVQGELRRRKPSVLVLDGLSIGVRFAGANEPDLNVFLNELSSLLEFHACTGVLCVLSPVGIVAAEHIMADGMIELTHNRVSRRGVRDLFVSKFRGSWTLDGDHLFTIDEQGARVFPRTEALLSHHVRVPSATGEQIPFGIKGLDAMLRGGVPSASTTALVGASGAGKTLLGLSLLAEGAKRGKPALYFGFGESPARILKQASSIGLSIEQLHRDGLVDILWRQPVEIVLDEIAGSLLERVERRGARFLFLDGIEGFERSAIFPERVSSFLVALTNRLSAENVTIVLSAESALLGPCVLPDAPWSAVVENAILLRYVELESKLRRLLSIVKVRGGGFDPSIREFEITSHGIEVSEPFQGTEAVLSGFARAVPMNLPNGGGDDP